MEKIGCYKMKKSIEAILEKKGKLEEFYKNEDFNFKVRSEGYMDLVIEKYGRKIIVAHYFEQNGDLIADPDFEMISAGGYWLPVALQMATGHYFVARKWDAEGRELINIRQHNEQIRFSHMWAKNISYQF